MAGILGRIPGRHIPSMMPFRPARNMDEAIRAQDALDAAVAAGDDTLARVIAASIRASDVPANEVGVMRSLRALEREPMDLMPPATFEDMAQDIDQSVRSYNWMRSGRGKLKNQWRGQIAGGELRRAAEEAISGRQQAAASENLGRAAALLGAGGLAGIIAETSGRMQGSPPGIVDMESVAMAPELAMDDPEMAMPDPAPVPVPVEEPELGDIEFEDPMGTADLVAESRPIPDSTPMALIREAIAAERAAQAPVGRLTPQEIAALRSQVVDIRDAQTGMAMDSFYPPDSEEYKAEQRMRLMYPQLRRR